MEMDCWPAGTIKPHKPASKNTIGHWIKLDLLKAGISQDFKPHSTWAAASSVAKLKGVPLQTLVKTAGWSNAKNFAKFYDKPIADNTRTAQSVVLLW